MPAASLTHKQVAKLLGHGERWLRDWLKRHPRDNAGRLFYCPSGRVKLFDEDDIRRLRAAIAEEAVRRAIGPRPLRSERVGYVYFIEGGDRIKIGYTTNGRARRKKMLTDAPVDLKLLHIESGTFRVEKMLHRQFAELRVRGEWFRKTPELLAFIEQRKSVAELAKGA